MALKVFDLQCDQGHLFEGWFGSHDDYDAQRARGLVSCPLCESTAITKRLSAPHLNVSHRHESAQESAPVPSGVPFNANDRPSNTQLSVAPGAMQAHIMRLMREAVRNTENVGPRFAEEARRIHEGEADQRPIRGNATPEEREALIADGIEVVALPAFLDDERLQ